MSRSSRASSIGSIHRYTYAEAERRSRRLAQALLRLGIGPGDRVGTLAWNNFRHFELYYGVSGIGAVCHTINPRLFDEQIVYIVNHARDRLLFVEAELYPAGRAAAAAIAGRLPHRPARTGRDEPAGARDAMTSWSRPRARTGSTGPNSTNGPPRRCATPRARPAGRKASLYSAPLDVAARLWRVAAGRHPGVEPRRDLPGRADVPRLRLERAVLRADERRRSWCCPGPHLDGASLYELFEAEGVTLSLGVPTVWLGFEAHLNATGARCSTFRRILSGGSAVPPSMITGVRAARHRGHARAGA